MVHRVRDPEMLLRFGARLREVRLEQGITQEDLAFAADVAISSIGRIETGKLNVTVSTIASIALALNVAKEELLKF